MEIVVRKQWRVVAMDATRFADEELLQRPRSELCRHKRAGSFASRTTSLGRTRQLGGSETPTPSSPVICRNESRRTDAVAIIVPKGAGRDADEVFGSHTHAVPKEENRATFCAAEILARDNGGLRH